MLRFYVDRFDTVEINNSFYRLPTGDCFARWREMTPPDFCFAVKGSRFLTHMKKLKDPEQGLARFFPPAENLKEKLGPILFQLPPHWGCHLERLEGFLNALPSSHRYAFEFRDATWHVRPVYDILTRHNAAFCIYHLGGFESAKEVTADFAYVRLHGPGGKYQGSYSSKALKMWAKRIEQWRERLAAVYVYFDNDDSGYAVKNALSLRELLG